MYNRFDPGGGCCGEPCRDSTYLPPFAEFPIAEGAPSESGDRWLMASGDRLQPPARDVAPSAEAWFHTLHLKSGDCDLHWDGLTIQYRSGPGTISADGHDSIVIPSGELAPGWADENPVYGVYLTLYVTPEWYAVMVAPWRDIGFESVRSGGSVQTIERNNTAASKSVIMTAVGDAAVASWRFADASADDECPARPVIPDCTERYRLSRAINFDLAGTGKLDIYEVQGEQGSGETECVFIETEDIGFSFPYTGGDVGNRCDIGIYSSISFGLPVIWFTPRIVHIQTVRMPTPTADSPYPRPVAHVSVGTAGGYSQIAVNARQEFDSSGFAPVQGTVAGETDTAMAVETVDGIKNLCAFGAVGSRANLLASFEIPWWCE